jgi:diguanylate cyclase (GGDEF)-like protein
VVQVPPNRADVAGMTGLTRLYAALAVILCGAYFFVPGDTWAQTGLAVGIGYLGVAAIIVGVRLHRPVGAAAWWWFAAGLFFNASGQLAEAYIIRVLHDENWPNWSLYVYYGLYPCLIAGIVILSWLRSTRRNWAAMVDATTIATGFALLSWVFVIGPGVGQPNVGLATQIWGVLFPAGDILLIAMMVRLLLGDGARNASFRFLTASLLVFLAGDVAWAVINQLAWEPGPMALRALSTNFFVAYLLLGAAALHRSVREVGQKATTPERRLSRPLLAALTLASLIAPALLAMEVAQGKVVDGLALVLGSVALFLLVVTRMAQLLREVDAQAHQLRKLARVDELTGLPNRRSWSSELPHAIERARRDGTPLAVAMIDLDYFKRFNDEYGHQAGDRLLKGAAAAWTGQLRTVDQLARYGGEEFIALLPGCRADEAVEILRRLREATPAGQSFSSGVALWDGAETSEEMIARADKALYEAKEAGRSRTVVAGEGADLAPVG